MDINNYQILANILITEIQRANKELEYNIHALMHIIPSCEHTLTFNKVVLE